MTSRTLTPLGWIVIWCLLIWSFVFAWSTGAWADSLTCDCSPAVDLVTEFQLQFNNADWITTPAVLNCGTGADKTVCTGDERTICFNLATLPYGSYTVTGRALNAGGMSIDSLPFTFTWEIIHLKPSSPLFLRRVI